MKRHLEYLFLFLESMYIARGVPFHEYVYKVNKRTTSVCEHQSVDLTCPEPGGFISVTKTYYGNQSPNPCEKTCHEYYISSETSYYIGSSNYPSQTTTYSRSVRAFKCPSGGDCSSLAGLNYAKGKCDGQSSCNVEAEHRYHGNLCDGFMTYLYVQYDCMRACNYHLKALPNCQNSNCTSGSNVWCIKCTDEDLYYKLVNRRCEDQCSSRNRWCWPGTCDSDLASRCKCMSGFRAVINEHVARCQPDIKPGIESCQIRAISSDGTEALSNVGSSSCSAQKDFYGRFQVGLFRVDLAAVFNVTIDSRPRPKFVPKELFGVTDVKIDMHKVSVTGLRTHIKTTSVKTDPSSSNPVEAFNKIANVTNNDVTKNGESICLNIKVKGGGYLVSKDLENHHETNVSYDKTESERSLCYIYDIEPPIHCSEAGTCKDEPMVLSTRLTSSGKIHVKINGWIDPVPTGGLPSLASGIEQFEISIFEVIESSPFLLMRDRSATGRVFKGNTTVNSIDIDLPTSKTMLYVILLETKDVANNAKQARRFVLFDNTSSIQINKNKPLWVNTASNETEHKWQINHGKICYQWNDRFYNNEYKKNNPMRPIKADTYAGITGRYDQVSGKLPINGTKNINGVTGYVFSLTKNDNLVSAGKVDEFMSETLCLFPTMADGDAFKLNLQAKDVMNHTLNDTTDIFIDRSVPEITDIWLVRDGHKKLYVHHTTDLSKMFIQFKAFDQHSGIKEVKWSFGINVNKTTLIEEAQGVTTSNDTNNTAGAVYCPKIGECAEMTFNGNLRKLANENKHQGNHNRRYFFKIKVLNNALLETIEHMDILVDDSPPEAGVVYEGPVGSPDIDYTKNEEITIHWHDFIDHESGIKIYRVVLSNQCLTDTSFNHVNNNYTSVASTVHDSITMKFPNGEGLYFVSIIAYNHAMSPSKIVCSDGITFDRSPPNIHNVSLKHGKTRESIACLNVKPWLLKENLRKVPLIGETCMNLCRNTTDESIVNILPEEAHQASKSVQVSDFFCSNIKMYTDNLIYTPTDLFELSWNITEDRSQVNNVFIGFGSDRSTIDNPDIQDYTKIHHLTSYVQRHPGLIGEERVYMFIRVLNRAGLERKISFGPLLADETPPLCPRTIRPVVSGKYFVMNWTRNDTFDTEQTEEIGKVLFRFGTGNSFFTPFLEWSMEAHGRQCGKDLHCIRYPISKLQKHNSQNSSKFYAQLHFYNYAGHFCNVMTSDFVLPFLFPPRLGKVFDVLPHAVAPFHDIDALIDPDQFCFAWNKITGINDAQFALGSNPNQNDLIGFTHINASHCNVLCESLPVVNDTQIYFVSLRVFGSGGTTVASSNGFMTLKRNNILASSFGFHGDLCDTMINTRLLHESSSSQLLIPSEIKRGLIYTLYSKENIDLVAASLYIKNTGKHRSLHFVTLYSFINTKSINFTNSINESVTLYRCDPFKESQTSTTSIPIHWTLDSKFEGIVTHYEVALSRMLNGQCNEELVFENVDNKQYHTFTGNFPVGNYRGFIKPCLKYECVQPFATEVISVVTNEVEKMKVEATLDVQDTCKMFSFTIHKYQCPESSHAVGYQWMLSNDVDGKRVLTDWRLHMNNNSTSEMITWEDQICSDFPWLPYRQMFACFQPYCKSGIGEKNCVPVGVTSDPNEFTKDIIYDLDLNNPSVKEVHTYRHSSNIGNKMSKLHEAEMDFAVLSVKIGGLMLGKTDRPITWFLTKKKEIPNKNCTFDPNCLISKTTNDGYVDFKNPIFKEKASLYICAVTSTDRLCSDGFLLSDKSPTAGTVVIDAYNGFIIDGSELYIKWNGFHGNNDAEKLGYSSDIAWYEYAIGTSIGSDDLQPFTAVGMETSLVTRDLSLKPGDVVIATVRAFNHINLSVETSSKAVVYDPTSPSKGTIVIDNVISAYISQRSLFVTWFDIEDKESGIARIEVGIGSHNNSADVIAFQEFIDEAEFSGDELLQDGHLYYVVIKATNRAGLYSFSVSSPFIIDSSPPNIGHVIEIDPYKDDQTDISYTTKSQSIMVTWYGFEDPDSLVAEYKVGLGTSPGNDDVTRFTSVGLKTSHTWHEHFDHGIRYYTTVSACNAARLCTSAESNGIVIDKSAPVPGLVLVGDPGKHTRYLSNGNSLHASWIGFEDPHSGIDHFEFCVGTTNSTCDVSSPMNVQLSSSFLKTNLNMTIGVPHYVTVTACNNVGLCTKRSSDSFIVDTTAPVNIQQPCLHAPHTVKDNKRNRLIITDPSFFIVEWKFEDSQSPITRTSLTLFSMNDSHVPIDEIVLTSENKYTVSLSSKDSLREGDVYTIKITACNSAHLCTTSLSEEILVDSTPPQVGGFKPPLTYETGNGKIGFFLSWFGFYDIQSNVEAYYVSIGDSYSTRNIVDDIEVLANVNSTNIMDNIEFSVRSNDIPDSVVLTVWAKNYAGLSSAEAKVTVGFVASDVNRTKGYLIIEKHSCDLYHCDEKCARCECTCGVVGKQCLPNHQTVCNVSSSELNSVPALNITVKLETSHDNTSATGSRHCLSSNWAYHSTLFNISRFEYSFGLKDSAVGEGIYNLSIENPWHDVGRRQSARHCLRTGELSHGSYYVAYTRAWISPVSYTILKSSPVIVDHTPPNVQKRHFVVDTTHDCGNDIDFLRENVLMFACWKGVFSDDESGIREFFVSLGTSPSVDDIVSDKSVGLKTSIEWTGIVFEQGVRYYTTVRAINTLGLQSELSSDGFLLDLTAPTEGVVFNTAHHVDKVYHSLIEPVTFSWHGFDDEHSFINSYQIAFEISRGNETIIKDYADVGLTNSVIYKDTLIQNDTIKAYVRAVDKTGLRSPTVTSKALLIDTTPPMAVVCDSFRILKRSNHKTENRTQLRIMETIPVKENDLLKIKVRVDKVKPHFIGFLTFNAMTMLMPFADNVDRSVVTEYTFLVEDSLVQNLTVQIDNVYTNSIIELTVFKCIDVNFRTDVSDTVEVQQMSQDEISVCLQTIDFESGIKQVSYGVGSTEGGFEIAASLFFPTYRHEVIKGNFTHGMNVFVEAMAENHAGLMTKFISKHLTFDKTPPIILDFSSELRYVEQNGTTLTEMHSSWKVEEKESMCRFCEFCIGSTPSSCDVIPRTMTDSLTEFRSTPSNILHGNHLYITLDCINKVQLTGSVHRGPLIVSINKPDSSNAKIDASVDVVRNMATLKESPFVVLGWNNFIESSGITSFKVKVDGIYERLSIPDKNYVRLRGLDDVKDYTFNIQAVNVGGLTSDVINRTLHVDNRPPMLTGKTFRLQHSTINKYTIQWSDVFEVIPTVLMYEVSVGSTEGSSDVVMPIGTRGTSVDIDVPDGIYQIYVTVTGTTLSGKATSHRETILLR